MEDHLRTVRNIHLSLTQLKTSTLDSFTTNGTDTCNEQAINSNPEPINSLLAVLADYRKSMMVIAFETICHLKNVDFKSSFSLKTVVSGPQTDALVYSVEGKAYNKARTYFRQDCQPNRCMPDLIRFRYLT